MIVEILTMKTLAGLIQLASKLTTDLRIIMNNIYDSMAMSRYVDTRKSMAITKARMVKNKRCIMSYIKSEKVAPFVDDQNYFMLVGKEHYVLLVNAIHENETDVERKRI